MKYELTINITKAFSISSPTPLILDRVFIDWFYYFFNISSQIFLPVIIIFYLSGIQLLVLITLY